MFTQTFYENTDDLLDLFAGCEQSGVVSGGGISETIDDSMFQDIIEPLSVKADNGKIAIGYNFKAPRSVTLFSEFVRFDDVIKEAHLEAASVGIQSALMSCGISSHNTPVFRFDYSVIERVPTLQSTFVLLKAGKKISQNLNIDRIITSSFDHFDGIQDVYHNALQESLHKMGYETRETYGNDPFEIAEITQEKLDEVFSNWATPYGG